MDLSAVLSSYVVLAAVVTAFATLGVAVLNYRWQNHAARNLAATDVRREEIADAKQLRQDLHTEMVGLREEVGKLSQEVKIWRDSYYTMREENLKLSNKVDGQTEEIARLIKEVDDLRESLSHYPACADCLAGKTTIANVGR